MIAEIRDLRGFEPEQDVRYLPDVLSAGRETPISRNAQGLVDMIDSLVSPDLQSDAALLIAAYYFKFGLEGAIKATRLQFGNDVEERLGISFRKKGLPNRPGTDAIIERVISPDDLLPYYQDLQLEMTRNNFILEMPVEPKLYRLK